MTVAAFEDTTPMTVRCVLQDCTWSFEGPAAEAREAAAEHRANNHQEVASWVKGVVEGGNGSEAKPVETVSTSFEENPVDLDKNPVDLDKSNGSGATPPSGRTNAERQRRGWEKSELISLLQAYAAEHDGCAPGFMDWKYSEPGRPTSQTFRKVFGSWNSAVEAAGLQPRLIGETIAKPRGVDVRTKNGWAVKVPGTGLAYRSPEEAYVAAQEVEDDGERVAAEARFDGNDGKADQAIDRSRDLAEQIRIAARSAERKPIPAIAKPSVPESPSSVHESPPVDMRQTYIAMLLRKADETTDPELFDRLERLLGFGDSA